MSILNTDPVQRSRLQEEMAKQKGEEAMEVKTEVVDEDEDMSRRNVHSGDKTKAVIREEEEDKRCLFCGMSISTGVSSKEKYCLLPGAEGNCQVNRQMWVLFILRNLLAYPQEKIVNLMKKTFGIPLSDWFELCSVCLDIANEAMKVHLKVLKLEEDIKKYRDEIKMKIGYTLTRDLDNSTGTGYAVVDVRREIRKHFQAGVKVKVEIQHSGEESASLMDEDPASPCEFEAETEDFYDNGDYLENDITDPLYIPSSEKEYEVEKSTVNVKLRNRTKSQLRPKKQKNKKGFKFTCKICLCERLYTNVDSFRRHMNCHEVSEFPCPTCKYPCASASVLKFHQARGLCNRTFQKKKGTQNIGNPTKPTIISPEIKTTDSEPILPPAKADENVADEDEDCKSGNDGIPTNQKNLPKIQPLLRRRKTIKRHKFTCKICLNEPVFRNIDSFKRHMTCHEVSKFHCPTCKYPCSNASALRGHEARSFCDKKIRSKNASQSVEIEDASDATIIDSPEIKTADNEPILPPEPTDENMEGDNEEECKTDKDWTPTNDHNEEEKESASESEKRPRKRKKVSKRRVYKGLKLYCKICLSKRLFTNLDYFNTHMRCHKEWEYSCPKCKFPCKTASVLETHIKRKRCHRIYEYRCRYCSFVAKKKIQRDEHIKTVHAHLKEQKPRLNLEYSDHGGTKLIRCKICLCTRVFSNKPAYQRHMDRHSVNKHPCPKCKFPCATDKELNSHVSQNSCERSNILYCNFCEFVTVTQTPFKLKQHLTDMHPEEAEEAIKSLTKRKVTTVKNQFTCPTCSLQFTNANQLQYENHLRKHQYFENCEVIDGKLKCKICGELTAGPYDLRQHTRKLHAAELGVPVYPCDKCEKVFARDSALSNHIKEVHTNQCRFYCEVCGYGTMSNDTLRRHMMYHGDEKSFVCELCAASFKTNNTLRNHKKKVHSSGREGMKFPCKYCRPEMTFVSKSLLDRHLKDTHKDLYVHNCDECENVYMSVASLQLHKKVHHSNQQQAECQFCQSKVINQVYLYSHYRLCKKKPPGFKFTVPRS